MNSQKSSLIVPNRVEEKPANNSPDKHSPDKIPFPVCIPLPAIPLPILRYPTKSH